MRKNILLLLFFLFTATFFYNESKAQSGLIYYWHFNNTQPSDGKGGMIFGPHPIYADYTASSSNAALVYKPINSASADTGSMDNVKGDNLNEQSGFGGCCGAANNAIRVRNPSDNMEFLWFIPTGNYQNIIIKYETKSSSAKSGQHDQLYSYSVDSGLTYISTGLPVLSFAVDTVWKLVTLDLSPITSINDNRKFVLRIEFSAPNTGSKGNNRFDNITVEGVKLSTEILRTEEAECSLFPNPAENNINLRTINDGIKEVSIYNSVGSMLSNKIMEGTQLSINISQLEPGLYFLRINDQIGKNYKVMNFLKK
jgi:hypothetical protein